MQGVLNLWSMTLTTPKNPLIGLEYCAIVQEQIVRLWISNTRQVLHFCMWNFIWADKAH
jgi:hypothetical protein